ncbi:MAG: ADOP family duplicated permease [Vicinamibacterales bacterium]
MSHMPPSAAERLLRWSIRDAEWRDAVSGDLREEFDAMVHRRGPAAARRWYWRQAASLATRFTAGRVVPGALPRRPWALAEVDESGFGAGWLREFRHAWRSLWHRPALSAIIVATLAIALAANATIFNLADALYLRPFRMSSIDRVVLLASSPADQQPFFERESVAPADFREWTGQLTTLTDLAAAEWWDPNVTGNDQPEQLAGFRVSPGFFDLLGVQPVIGRTFRPEEGEPGASRRVLLAFALWQRRFAGDPGIIGQVVRLDGEPYEVIGVMPPRFAIPFGAEVWSPLAFDDAGWAERKRGYLMAFARLAPGQSIDAARAEFGGVVSRQAAAHPDTNAERGATVVSFTRGMADPGAGPFLALWQAAAFLLLLIACANVANLLLARGAERQQEFALRLALGARSGRLLFQMLIEGTCLAILAVLAAVPLAWVGATLTHDFLPASIIRFVPGYEYIGMDLAALGIMAALGAVATALFSLVPALQASRAAVTDSLRQGGRTMTASGGRQWVRTALAAAQVALTLALVVASSLILRAVDGAVNGELGFDKRDVLTARLTLPEQPYADAGRRRQFITRVLDHLDGVPAVTGAAVTSTLPYAGSNTGRDFYPEGQTLTPAEVRSVDYRRVTPGYLDTMKIPLLAGRGLTDNDRDDTRPVALVSASLAERYWPGADPIGRRFRTAPDGEWIEVVGVAGDVMHDWFMNQHRPTVFRPVGQDVGYSMAIVARTIGDPTGVAGEMRRAIALADPDQPIQAIASMDQVVADKVAGIGYLAHALAVMSGIALALALMGMYSLMAYLAARRTQEIGVRLALGATKWQVIRLTATQAVRITAIGVVIGTAMAVGVGRVMESALFGLVTLGPLQLAGIVLALTAVALLAGYLPARRAANLDPALALRTE